MASTPRARRPASPRRGSRLRYRRSGAATLLGLAALLPLAAGTPAAMAIPRLDLKGYPTAGAGEQRWVIQLPGVLSTSPDANLSPRPIDWRVQLIVGRETLVDCNGPRFSGRIRTVALPALGTGYYRVSDVGPMISTRMACPPGEPKRQAFVPMLGKPFVVPYNASLPIVIIAPKDLEVRWRLWKAERQQQKAQQL
ncbi:MAG: ecotin family protein [Synechococcaceae cyanobacterium]|nr:ecotin family protein [Synechococcaceae cyanobacterium]